MGTMLCKQAADRATSPKSFIFLKSPAALTFGIMRFSPHSSGTERKIEGVCPPDPSTMARCERDGSCGGSRKMMMMITGEERQEGSGVGHISPPVGHQLINLFLTFREGVSQSERSKIGRKSPFDFGGWTSREWDNLGSNPDLSPNVTPLPPPRPPIPRSSCHHLSRPAGIHLSKRNMKVPGAGCSTLLLNSLVKKLRISLATAMCIISSSNGKHSAVRERM